MKLEDLMTELAKMTALKGGGKYGAREEWLASFEELQEMVVSIVPAVGKLVALAEAAKGHGCVNLVGKCRICETLAALEAAP